MTIKRTTIKDIARECGVSLSTVSLVLNNNPRISEKTRRQVLASIRKHGYQPNAQARSLASHTTRTISVVVPHLNHVFADIYFGEIVSGIYEYATSQGYKLMLDVANESFIKNHEYVNLLKARRADGMLFIASSVKDTYLRVFENEPYVFLLVNHYFPGSHINFIAVDYRESARQAADHIVGLGHRRIGLIAGTNTYTGLDFRDAFLARCREHGLGEDTVFWVEGGVEWSQEEGYAAAKVLLENHPDLTAIVAGNDRMALGVLRYVQMRDWRVPADISVMGVDDISQAAFTIPALTTIRHNLFQLGQLSCKRLLTLFRKEIPSCHEYLTSSLVLRESTGPAKNA